MQADRWTGGAILASTTTLGSCSPDATTDITEDAGLLWGGRSAGVDFSHITPKSLLHSLRYMHGDEFNGGAHDWERLSATDGYFGHSVSSFVPSAMCASPTSAACIEAADRRFLAIGAPQEAAAGRSPRGGGLYVMELVQKMDSSKKDFFDPVVASALRISASSSGVGIGGKRWSAGAGSATGFGGAVLLVDLMRLIPQHTCPLAVIQAFLGPGTVSQGMLSMHCVG